MKGARIHDLGQLADLVKKRRSVLCSLTNYKRPFPAAWVINLQGHVLHRMLSGSGVFEYRGKTTRCHALGPFLCECTLAAGHKGDHYDRPFDISWGKGRA